MLFNTIDSHLQNILHFKYGFCQVAYLVKFEGLVYRQDLEFECRYFILFLKHAE